MNGNGFTWKQISLEEFVEKFSFNSKETESEHSTSTNTVPYPRISKDYASSCQRYKGLSATNFNDPVVHMFMSKAISNIHVSEPRYGSVRRLDELEAIRLKDMLVNKRHTGKFLLCRVLANPFLMPAMHFLVQDEDGEVEDLAVYNYMTRYVIDPGKIFHCDCDQGAISQDRKRRKRQKLDLCNFSNRRDCSRR